MIYLLGRRNIIRNITFATFFLCVIFLCSPVQATHIQYLDLADVSNVSIGATDTWEKTFDLKNDSMYLWEINTHYSSSNTTPDPSTADYMGSYNPSDTLHYVTMRIDPNNIPPHDPTSKYIKLEINGIEISGWHNPIRIYEWGVPNPPISDVYGIVDADYQIAVKLTGLSILDGMAPLEITNVNLEGCFETTQVPEPVTFILFGFGILGIAGLSRKNMK